MRICKFSRVNIFLVGVILIAVLLSGDSQVQAATNYMEENKSYIFTNTTGENTSFSVGLDWGAAKYSMTDLVYEKDKTNFSINVRADSLRIKADGSNGAAAASEYICFTNPVDIKLSAGEKIIIKPQSDVLYGLSGGITVSETSTSPIKRYSLTIGHRYTVKNNAADAKTIYFSGVESPNTFGNLTIRDKDQKIIKQIRNDYIWFLKNVGCTIANGYEITIEPTKKWENKTSGSVTIYLPYNVSNKDLVIYGDDINNNGTENISVYINNKKVVFDQPPIVKDGRTLVPIRAIAEALGSNVSWNQQSQTAIIQRGLETAVFQIGKNKAYSGKIINLDVGAQVINGRTLIPLRAISEIFGAAVKWDESTRSVYITCKELTDKMITDEFYNIGFYKFNYYNNFVSEHADLDYAFKKVLSEIGDFGTRIIVGEGKNIVSGVIAGDFSRMKISNSLDDYQQDVLEENIRQILDNLLSTRTVEVDDRQSSIENIVKGAKNTVEAMQLMENNGELLSQSQQQGLDNLIKSPGYAEAGIKLGNLGLDVYEIIMTDYFNQIQYLEVIDDSTSSDDELMQKAVDELYKEFANKYVGVLNKILDKAIEEGASSGSKYILDAASGSLGSLYSVTTFALETTFAISGATEYANNIEKATALMAINYNLMLHYNTLKSDKCSWAGDISASDTEWSNIVAAFSVTKAGLIEAYQCMADVSTNSVEQIYLESQVGVLESLHISQKVPVSKDNMFTYGKFCMP